MSLKREEGEKTGVIYINTIFFNVNLCSHCPVVYVGPGFVGSSAMQWLHCGAGLRPPSETYSAHAQQFPTTRYQGRKVEHIHIHTYIFIYNNNSLKMYLFRLLRTLVLVVFLVPFSIFSWLYFQGRLIVPATRCSRGHDRRGWRFSTQLCAGGASA